MPVLDLLHYAQSFWRPFAEITIFYFAYYFLFIYISGSGMAQALKGLFILVLLFFVSEVLEFRAIRWVLAHLFQISIIGFLIIFQAELRRGLTRIGQTHLFKLFLKEENFAAEIVRAVTSMSAQKTGALIAIEREIGLKSYIESGITLDAVLTSELLTTIFMHSSPFHDGGTIIQGGRVTAVGCLFPLSESQKLSKAMGTRHRAGLGLSEESDAVVIVVSEETGTVSLMNQGGITRGVGEEQLRASLTEIYQPQKTKRKRRENP